MASAWRVIRSSVSATHSRCAWTPTRCMSTARRARGPSTSSNTSTRCVPRSPPRRGPGPKSPGLPFAGGLVGVSGYDVVRLFEKLPRETTLQDNIPDAAFVAPASLLVFDHLTRRVALLHDGPEAERKALRSEVIRLLRGAVPNGNGQAKTTPPKASLSRARVLRARQGMQGIHRVGRHLPDRDVGAVSRPLERRAVRGVPCAAPAESVAVHVLSRIRRPQGGRLLARGAGEAQRRQRIAATDRRHPAARRGPANRTSRTQPRCSPTRKRPPST